MARQLLTAADFKELPIPQGLIAWWFGTYTSIPSGWAIADGGAWPEGVDPALGLPANKPSLCNGRYLVGVAAAGDSPGATGGNSTHTHSWTSASHSHTSNASDTTASIGNDCSNIPEDVGSHNHTVNSGTLAALSNGNNSPEYLEAIPIVFIKRAGGHGGPLSPRDLKSTAMPPWKIIAAWPTATPPTGWSKCTGATVNGVATPNLLGKHIRGIATTGTNPSSAGAGSNTHTHSITHSHTTGRATVVWQQGSKPNQHPATNGMHSHTIQSTTVDTQSGDNTPPNVAMQFICFTGWGPNAAAHPVRGLVGGADVDATLLAPRGIGMLWSDPVSGVPSGWRHADGGTWANGAPSGYGANRPMGLNKFLKHVSNSTTNGGGTSGAENNTHSHTSAAHGHTTSGSNNPSNTNRNCYYLSGDSGPPRDVYACPFGHSHDTSAHGTITWESGLSDSTVPYHATVAILVRD